MTTTWPGVKKASAGVRGFRPQKSRVSQTSSIHAVHESQQSGHDGGVDLLLFAASHRCQTYVCARQSTLVSPHARESHWRTRRTINFVKEDDAGLLRFRLVEQKAKLSLGLTDPLAQTVRALAHKESWASGELLARPASLSLVKRKSAPNRFSVPLRSSLQPALEPRASCRCRVDRERAHREAG